jgi:crotonobetainyl-CoA:carnitine CoA-transferase CaiB-like acyl-CoA transferase
MTGGDSTSGPREAGETGNASHSGVNASGANAPPTAAGAPGASGASDGHRSLPLRGLRVLDFTRVLAGPLCTMLLGDMGADVIKVEDPRYGDDTRAWAPFVDGWSTYFLTVNRNKRSVAVDLKSAAGAALIDDLIRTSDVLVENFRPGTLERLGFGQARAREINERLIYCSISGYGTTGPRSNLPGYDMVIQGESGLMDVTGFPDNGPTKVGIAITDCLAALYASQGILLAHISRQQTGKGQFLDIALLDAAVSVLGLPAGIASATGTSPGHLGNAHPSLAPYEPFPAADGQVIVAVANPRLWSRFCRAVGLQAIEFDPRFATNGDRLEHRVYLNEIIGERFAHETVESLLARLEAEGVPCGRVRTIDAVLQDPQLAARQMLLDMMAGTHTVRVPGNPIKLSDIPPLAAAPPPELGAHTDEVRREVEALKRQAAERTHLAAIRPPSAS